MINLKDNILKNQKLIMYGVIGLLILIADFHLVLKPVIGGLTKVTPEVNAKTSRVNIMDVNVKGIQNYKKQIENYKTNLSGYKRKFSTKGEISPLLKNLSDTAKAHGVKIVSITPLESIEKGPTKATGAYRKIPIYLNAVSKYHPFGLFLNKLENSDTFMRIVDLKISGGTSETGDHRFRVTVVTYILGAAEEEK